MRVFDFVCEDGHRGEHFIHSDVRTVACHECGKPAHRAPPAVRANLDGTSGDFPGAAMAWERRREDHMKWERKQLATNGEIPGNPMPKRD